MCRFWNRSAKKQSLAAFVLLSKLSHRIDSVSLPDCLGSTNQNKRMNKRGEEKRAGRLEWMETSVRGDM